MKEPFGFLPKARREGIITKEVDGELLVYDRTRDKAHCLNESAAAIWKLCDGQTTTEEIARQLGSKASPGSQALQPGLGVTVRDAASQELDQFSEHIVWLALSELRRSHLLEEPSDVGLWPQTILGMSRREAVRLIGIGVAVPIVVSITAPTSRAAASCGLNNAACNTSADCCSGVCTPNVPGPGKHCVGNGP